MKVALVHDWLTGMRGGEKCLEAFCEMFPDAPIYTLIHAKGSVSTAIEQHAIFPSSMNVLPSIEKFYRYFLPIFPSVIQSFTFDNFDLILSSSHCVAKGVRVPEGCCHISYVHTPMRYVWEGYDQYFRGRSRFSLGSIGMAIFRDCLQRWDMGSNNQVHEFIANSHNVAERISRHYGRKAAVVHPPVDWHAFEASERDEGYYLMVTAFAPYKRVDLGIQAANQLKVPLKIIGRGQEENKMKRLAGPTVEFLGWETDACIREHYRNCRAILFPGEEDFGIVPLEAMASGKPVIAYGKGGVLETVIPLNLSPPMATNGSPTGVFFYEQTLPALVNAIQIFEKRKILFNPYAIRAHVKDFGREHFKRNVQQVILTTYEKFCQSRVC